MSRNEGSELPKPPFPTKRSDSRVLRGYCGAQQYMGQAHLFTGSLKAQAEEGGSPSSIAQSTNGPREAAEDGAALGWPKAPPRKGAKAA